MHVEDFLESALLMRADDEHLEDSHPLAPAELRASPRYGDGAGPSRSRRRA